MKKLGIWFAVISLAVLLALGAAAATMTYDSYQNPVANGADPFVLKDGDTYYLYATEDGSWGYRVYTSKNLVDWVCHGYCLQKGDVYLDDPSAYAGFWAPEVFKYNGVYYMIYTAQEHLGIATSDSPYGPFTNDTEGGWLFDDFKCIDGHFFEDTDGRIYLYFVSTGAVSMNGYSVSSGNNIWGVEFDMDTLTAKTQPKLLITARKAATTPLYPENNVAEGPEMLKYNGVYHLTFSACGYTNTKYAVNDATSNSPLGTFTRCDSTNPVMITADPSRNNPANNLYGTGHHCFTTSPDGSEIVMVYHAHRSGIPMTNPPEDADEGTLYVESRRVCIDKVTFDGDGVMHAGVNDHPTVGTQNWVPSGAVVGRTVELDENFEALLTLPTVYVSYKSGNDETNDGLTRNTPFLTLDRAYAALPNGGTIVLTEYYAVEQYSAPAVNGPIMIRGDYSCVIFNFKFFDVGSDTYFDNLTFCPRTTSTYSIIQCGFNNVVFGENIGCSARPNAEQFPVLTGGRWWYTGSSTSALYDPYRASTAECTTDKAYTLKVLGGTWSIATQNSLKATTVMGSSAPNATLVLGEGAIIRPAKAVAPTVAYSNGAAVLTMHPASNTVNAPYVYAVFKTVGGKDILLGYTAEGEDVYRDNTYVFGSSTDYKVSVYVNGACFGDLSNAVTLTVRGDYDDDGEITILDALTLLRSILDGAAENSLLDVLHILKVLAN